MSSTAIKMRLLEICSEILSTKTAYMISLPSAAGKHIRTSDFQISKLVNKESIALPLDISEFLDQVQLHLIGDPEKPGLRQADTTTRRPRAPTMEQFWSPERWTVSCSPQQ